jgi:hypothetical protein
MKKRSRIAAIVVLIGIFFTALITLDLHCTYRTARMIAASEAARFDDCVYVKTKLSYRQIVQPPAVFRFPHWEVTYSSTNPSHWFTRFVTLSEAIAKATNGVRRTE